MKIFSLHAFSKPAKLIAAIIISAGTTCPAFAFSPSSYAGKSRLAEGRWTKISTDTAGICEISYERLKQWGYDDPAAVHVYGPGPLALTDDALDVSVPDDVRPTFTINDPGRGRIFFYSPGTVSLTMTTPDANGVTVNRTLYTSRAYFLLSDSPLTPADTVIPPVSAPAPGAGGVDAHYSVGFVEYELQNPADGGAVFLGPDITQNNEVFFTFGFKNMGRGTTSWSTATMKVNFAGIDAGGQTRATLDLRDHLKSSDVKSTVTAIPIVYDETVAYRHGSVQMTWNKQLDGDLTFGVTPYGKSVPRFLAFDNAWTAYPRLSIMDGGDASLDMYFPGVFSNTSFTLEAPSAVRVLNITDLNAIYEHLLAPGADGKTMVGRFDRSYTVAQTNPDPTCRLLAFNPDVPQIGVTYEGQIANSDLHGVSTPDMLIITTAAMRPAAEELAAIHARTDGLECLVVDHEAIFNEFSYANPDAMAYRRFAKMLYDRDPDKLRYILLYGPGHWDNRGILADRSATLLTYQVKNELYAGNTTRNYNADAFFGMLGDSNHPSGIQNTGLVVPVGRIPAPTLSAARAVNAKIERILSRPRPARLFSKALVLSDDGDRNVHFTQAEQLIGILQSGHAPMTIVRAHNLVYPWEGTDAKMARELAVDAIVDGVGLMTYTGHGHPNGFTGEQMWSRSIVQSFEADYPPFVFLSTCDALAFDRDQEGIGATMLLKDGGGAAAVIGACRTVYSPQNQELMIKLTDVYAKASPSATVGDVWLAGRRLTLTSLAASTATQFNTMCYNLCGDPSLPIGAPGLDITIDSVDGAAPGESVSLNARCPVALSGRITRPDGSTASDFNGLVTVNVYDTPVEVATNPRNPVTDPVVTATLDHTLLTSKSVQATDGRFDLDIFLPYPTVESDRLASRIVLLADGDDGLSKAAGLLTNVSIKASGTAAGLNPPSIDVIALDSFSNGEGAIITDEDTHTLVARGTTDGTGLNSSSAIGVNHSLVIDPESDSPVTLHPGVNSFVYDGDTWTLRQPLPALTPGNHLARLTIVDNAENRAYSTIGFTVIGRSPLALSVENGNSTLTAYNPLTIGLVKVDEDADLSVADSRLVVRDNLGNSVYTVSSPVFPLTLSLADTRLATGRYEIYLIGKDRGVPFATPAVPVTVIRTGATQ
ncbi:MAG: hypothetical protein K2K84_01145 [Muribaculaceae bacterium]|nr:hypothetical protein [Muribaculaceae bacterium]